MAAASLLTAGAMAATAAAAGAETIYDNVQAPKAKNLVSLGYEATQTSEFGGLVKFAGADRLSPTVTIQMSSWACQNLEGGEACHTEKGASFSWPITLNVYERGAGEAVGAKVASETLAVNVPYRPSANNKHCHLTEEGVVGWGSACFNGKAFRVSFHLAGVTLPAEAILSVAYDTTDYGAEPTHTANVGEDSLNLGLTEPASFEAPTPVAPSVGTDPLPEDDFINSLTSGNYGGKGTVGTFSVAGEWTGFQPIFLVKASAARR
ncbi:MAG TPA: hypothetical protein VGY13_03040 [Solirubrobacteraceae bacterium]|jgi:hypothetical protein|nr:hypothetical protein [Solirubrobacteraceae bacterium]